MGSIAGHGVVALVVRELEAVVATGPSPGVELVTTETCHQAWLVGLEVCHLDKKIYIKTNILNLGIRSLCMKTEDLLKG